jgi:hypothetical protein
MPLDAGDKAFDADMTDDIYGEFEDDLDEDDLDRFDEDGGGENFEDFGFEENWN